MHNLWTQTIGEGLGQRTGGRLEGVNGERRGACVILSAIKI